MLRPAIDHLLGDEPETGLVDELDLEGLGFDDQDLRQGRAMDSDLHVQAPLGLMCMFEHYVLVQSGGDR